GGFGLLARLAGKEISRHQNDLFAPESRQFLPSLGLRKSLQLPLLGAQTPQEIGVLAAAIEQGLERRLLRGRLRVGIDDERVATGCRDVVNQAIKEIPGRPGAR